MVWVHSLASYFFLATSVRNFRTFTYPMSCRVLIFPILESSVDTDEFRSQKKWSGPTVLHSAYEYIMVINPNMQEIRNAYKFRKMVTKRSFAWLLSHNLIN